MDLPADDSPGHSPVHSPELESDSDSGDGNCGDAAPLDTPTGGSAMGGSHPPSPEDYTSDNFVVWVYCV